jgi:hypothetical protein
MARTGRVLAAACIALALGLAPSAGAVAPPSPWDGKNPFNCVLQHAGMTAKVAHPEADPFCIDFDKRHQNVSQLGVVDFLSKEPARVAVAVPKCFYFQSDHWRGSIVQSNGATKTYEWDGHYFFDKAKAEGGAWVTNFNINGKSGDPTVIPGFPAQYAPYFGNGTGGVITHDDVQGDPRCAERAKREGKRIYASKAGPEPPPRCVTGGGPVGTRRLGAIRLGDDESTARRSLGPPAGVKRGFLRWCVRGGGRYLVGQSSDRSGEFGAGSSEHAVLLVSSSRTFRYHGVGAGTSVRRLQKVFRRARRVTRYRHNRVWIARPRSRVLFGVRGRRVRFIAVRDRGVVRGRSGIARYLSRTR